MLPFLRSGDFDGALGAALTKVDAAATPAHAAELERGRQINAVLGLVGAPVIVFLGSSAGRCSTGGGSARTRSTSTIRRSSCRRRRPT